MKRALRDGTRWLVLDGVEFMQRIATLVPPKRQNLTRYHGVFASNSKLRQLVIPQKVKKAIDLPLCPRPKGGPWRTDWAELLRRVFAVDVLRCARCGGRMRLIAFVKKKSAAQKILPCTRLRRRRRIGWAPQVAVTASRGGSRARTSSGGVGI